MHNGKQAIFTAGHCIDFEEDGEVFLNHTRDSIHEKLSEVKREPKILKQYGIIDSARIKSANTLESEIISIREKLNSPKFSDQQILDIAYRKLKMEYQHVCVEGPFLSVGNILESRVLIEGEFTPETLYSKWTPQSESTTGIVPPGMSGGPAIEIMPAGTSVFRGVNSCTAVLKDARSFYAHPRISDIIPLLTWINSVAAER